MRYGYDTSGNLAKVINSSGESLRFAYDGDDRVTRWTDRNGTCSPTPTTSAAG
jgi:YD repeat-containing protein